MNAVFLSEPPQASRRRPPAALYESDELAHLGENPANWNGAVAANDGRIKRALQVLKDNGDEPTVPRVQYRLRR
jgi:hypothetical protein